VGDIGGACGVGVSVYMFVSMLSSDLWLCSAGHDLRQCWCWRQGLGLDDGEKDRRHEGS